MFRLIALFFVGIIIYRLGSVFAYNRKVKSKQKRDSGFSGEPAEFEIVDDRPRSSAADDPEASTNQTQ